MAPFNPEPYRSYPFRPRSRHTFRRYRALVAIVSVFLFCSWYFEWFTRTEPYAVAATRKIATPVRKHKGEPRIGKVSMLYGRRNELYERALDSHRRHNLIHGYGMEIMRHDFTQGYWNKLSWLLSNVVQELAKPESERLDWIMWVEAQNIILNPMIPLSAFLPPPKDQLDYIHFVGSRHDGALNAGAFFVRVHSWTVTFLTRAISLPMLDFSIEKELAFEKDINALAYVLNETAFSSNAFYQPRTWFNTLHTASALEAGLDDDDPTAPTGKAGYEGEPGSLLVQFPYASNGAKWKHMADWLEILRHRPNAFEMRFDKTFYPAAIKQYWKRIGEARDSLYFGEIALDEASAAGNGNAPEYRKLSSSVNSLTRMLWWSADDDAGMAKAIAENEKALKKAAP
jgi:hypothetical protein